MGDLYEGDWNGIGKETFKSNASHVILGTFTNQYWRICTGEWAKGKEHGRITQYWNKQLSDLTSIQGVTWEILKPYAMLKKYKETPDYVRTTTGISTKF